MIASFRAGAAVDVEGELRGWLATVTYDGCEEPFIQEYYGSIVMSGFARVHAVNPALVEDRIATTLRRGKRVIFKCRGVGTALAYINKNPVVLIAAAYSEQAIKGFISENLKGDPTNSEEANAKSAKLAVELNRSSIFHETLHYFGFDNLPVSVHNKVNFLVGPVSSDDPRFADTYNPLRGASLDVVHSCTALGAGSPMRTQVDACGLAEVVNGKVQLPWDAIVAKLRIKTAARSFKEFYGQTFK